MKRISYLLLPLLLLSALAPFAPFTLAAGAVSGAAFTTVNVAVDGPGHCLNGNPAVNCNIYNGKSFVWLNGGPKANKLGPSGQYFFAVLAPGGQSNANDGSPKNLSDDFDKYTNRTFTVTNGKVSAYSGTHTFNRNLIRLFPYANTPNPGGVYILAVCSLSNGYPVKASLCKFDQFKIMRALPPTNTPTPTACVPQTETKTEQAKFTQVLVGDPVQGLGVVAPDLDIMALHQAVRIQEGVDPWVYWAFGPKGPDTIKNGHIDSSLGGFGDPLTKDAKAAALYTFTFTPGATVSDFKLHMLDYGDWNPALTTTHLVTLNAYNDKGDVVATQELSYTSDAGERPTTSNKYGNLQTSGDAALATAGQPGNFTWHVSGTGITMVKLIVGVGQDSAFGLDLLSFTVTKVVKPCP